MSDRVICCEGLSKSYLVGHERPLERYTALRDVLARQAKQLWNATRRAVRGDAAVAGDQVEDFWALRDVSFDVKQGEVVGIIGRNGAGKSTLLKILSRITEPTKGRATLRGRVASLLEVGTGFHPELTGRENVFLNGAILGMSRTEIRRKFDAIVEFAEIEKFLDMPVKRYSSGMYVRLAFAVAAHLEPEVLIVDEVLAVGDAAFQRKCLGKMKDVAGCGQTVLFVSHNLSAVSQLCHRGAVLDNGRLLYVGSTEGAIGEYTSQGAASVFARTKDELCISISYVYVARADAPYTPVSALYRGDTLLVTITVANSGPSFDAAFGMSIELPSLTRVIASNTLSNSTGWTCHPGNTSVSFELPNVPLNQGHYFLTVAVHDWNNGRTIDRVDQCLSFEVLEPCNSDSHRHRRPNDGIVICDEARWTAHC